MVLDAESLATYLTPVHRGPVGVGGLHSIAKSLPKCDLAATFPPTVLGAAVPWPGAFGTMIDCEFGHSLQSEDSGVFSSTSQGQTSLESFSSDTRNCQV